MQACLSIDSPLTAFLRFFKLKQIQRLQLQDQNALYLMTQLKEWSSPGKTRKNLEQSQLQSMSSSTSSRNQTKLNKQHEEQNEIELSQRNKQNIHLNSESSSHNLPINEVHREVSLVQRLLNRKGKIMKWFMVLSILIFAVWFGSRFLTESLSKKRHPMFLSAFSPSKASEVMSPQQSDYTSFLYYRMMINLTEHLVKQKRDPTKEEMNKFREMTFKQFYNAYKVVFAIQLAKEYKTKQQQKQIEKIQETNLDQFVNKTEYFQDAVNQFSCSSCYSFPIAATIEYMYKFYYNITVKLSEQQLIDCAHDQSQNGCEQGNITRGFQYARDVGLLRTEEYPYRSITGTSYKCDTQTINSTKQRFKISGFKMLPRRSCQSIQSQLIKGNVVAAMIHAGELASYTDGTFTECVREGGWNHAVTIVGQTEKNEWIVRNSWGKNWGNNGYFVMGHGNTCGVCQYAIVPILKMQNGTVIPYNPKDDETKKQEK